MSKVRICYTDAAVDDLDLIFAYIEPNDREAALSMLDRLETGILRLKDAPNLGAALRPEGVPHLTCDYRYISVSPYLVFYRVEGDRVIISRILHEKRNWLYLVFSAP